MLRANQTEGETGLPASDWGLKISWNCNFVCLYPILSPHRGLGWVRVRQCVGQSSAESPANMIQGGDGTYWKR